MAIFTRKSPDRPELPTGHKDESSQWYVASDLRDYYLAHSPTFHEIKREVERIVKERGEKAWVVATEKEAKKGNLAPAHARREAPRRSPAPGMPGPQELARERASSERAAAENAGEQEGDAELAEHRARLTFAKQCKAEHDEAERTEKRRQDARCRCCGALDVPTAVPVLTLVPAPKPHDPPSNRNKARTYTVGEGPVCAHCRVVVLETETARVAAQKVDGVTRAELAKQFIERNRR